MFSIALQFHSKRSEKFLRLARSCVSLSTASSPRGLGPLRRPLSSLSAVHVWNWDLSIVLMFGTETFYCSLHGELRTSEGLRAFGCSELRPRCLLLLRTEIYTEERPKDSVVILCEVNGGKFSRKEGKTFKFNSPQHQLKWIKQLDLQPRPLICVDDIYICGWSEKRAEAEKHFEKDTGLFTVVCCVMIPCSSLPAR